MAKSSFNSEYSCLCCGAKVPEALGPVREGVCLGFNGGFMLICAMNRPTDEEKQAFKSSSPYQFDFITVDGVIFFLARFGTLRWMDMPFNIHLYPDNRARLLEVPGPTQGYGLHIMLIDSSTGILIHQRLIGLDHDLSMRLHDAIINQPVIPNYDQRLQRIMAQYSTMDLVALANGHPSTIVKSNMVTGMPQLRPSHRGLIGIRKDDYPLPEELRKFNYYYPDAGHVVMVIPESLLPRATESGNFDDYECPIPCRYILAKGYRFLEGYVVCDAPYDKEFGVSLDESWYDE